MGPVQGNDSIWRRLPDRGCQGTSIIQNVKTIEAKETTLVAGPKAASTNYFDSNELNKFNTGVGGNTEEIYYKTIDSKHQRTAVFRSTQRAWNGGMTLPTTMIPYSLQLQVIQMEPQDNP